MFRWCLFDKLKIDKYQMKTEKIIRAKKRKCDVCVIFFPVKFIAWNVIHFYGANEEKHVIQFIML